MTDKSPVQRLVDGTTQVDLVSIFGPHRKQAEFLLNPSRNRYFLAGRGAGKSWALALDVLLSALVNPGLPGLFLARTLGEHKQNLLPYFDAHVDKLRKETGIQLVKRFSPGSQTIELVNGSTIVYKGFESSLAKVRQHSVCWAAVDECEWARGVSSEELMRAVKPCIRVPGPRQGLAIASSPNGLTGFTKLFHEHQLKKTRGWYTTRCPSWANPHLTQEDLDDWRETLSRDAYMQEVECIALRPRELIYHQFSPSKHIRRMDTEELLRQPNAKLCFGVDWGLNHAAALAAVVTRDGVWNIVSEITSEPKSRGHWQDQLDAWIATFRTEPYFMGCDRAEQREIYSLRNKYPRTAVRFCYTKAEQDVPTGLADVATLLDPAATVEPRLFFSDRLNRLDDKDTATIIPALENYKYSRLIDGTLSDQPVKDNKHDHSPDALRYMITLSTQFPELHGGRHMATRRGGE